jgi:hypothetical protein
VVGHDDFVGGERDQRTARHGVMLQAAQPQADEAGGRHLKELQQEQDGMTTMSRDQAKKAHVASPVTPAIAPEAQKAGMVEVGLKTACAKAAATPHAR